MPLRKVAPRPALPRAASPLTTYREDSLATLFPAPLAPAPSKW